MTFITAEVDTYDQKLYRVAADGVGRMTGSRTILREFIPGNEMYDDMHRLWQLGTPVRFKSNGYWYAESRSIADADPDLLEPYPWMLAVHPFNPRRPINAVVDVDGWADMPNPGWRDTLYCLRDGDERILLTWNETLEKYELPTAGTITHEDSEYNVNYRGLGATCTIGSLVFTMAASQGNDFNGWTVELVVSTSSAGTGLVGTSVDETNTTFTVNIPSDFTWSHAVSRMNETFPSLSNNAMAHLSVALVSGADGTAAVTGGTADLAGGIDGTTTYPFYQETGANAGQPLTTPSKLTFAPSSVANIDTDDLSLSSDGTTLTAHTDLHLFVKIDEISGFPDTSLTSGVWYDSDAASVVTGQSMTYAFVVRLVHKRGSVETNLWEEAYSGNSSNPETTSSFLTVSPTVHVEMQDGDELYVNVIAQSPSTESDPRSKEIEVDVGKLVVESYATETAVAIADQITFKRMIFESNAMTPNVSHYHEFDEPIKISEFSTLRSRVRFDRSEADFDKDATLDLSNYVPLADRAAAEALAINDQSRQRVVTSMFTNNRGRLDLYVGAGFNGWDYTANVIFLLEQWFWGDAQYLRGVKSHLYYNQVSDTNMWITEGFER